jgi:hypothetical protein
MHEGLQTLQDERCVHGYSNDTAGFFWGVGGGEGGAVSNLPNFARVASDSSAEVWSQIWSVGHHHHHLSVMELGHLLSRSGLMYPEASSKVCHGSFCQLGNSISLSWVINYGAFYLHVVSSFSCIPVICPKLVLFLTPLQSVCLVCW